MMGKTTAGLKLLTSPMRFIACVTQISPAVPVRTTMPMKITSRMSLSCGPRLGAADQCDTCADQNNADPPCRRNNLAEEEVAEHRDSGIPDRAHGLNETEVGPREKEQIGHEKNHEAENTKPDRRRCKCPEKNPVQGGGRVARNLADLFHSLSQENIT